MTNALRIKQSRAELTTEHKGEDLTFIHPSYGPDDYTNVKELIEKDNLEPPTMAETASLVHSVFNSDDTYSEEIKRIMKDKWLWAFIGILYIPNKGAYIQDNPRIKNGMSCMDQNELERKLEANDPCVRVVPFGFKTGEMSSLQLSKNEFIRAIAGEEGAEKLAEVVADKYRNKSQLYSFDSVNEPLTRVSALYSDWDLDLRLVISGLNHGYSRDGHAFGVRRAREINREKKWIKI